MLTVYVCYALSSMTTFDANLSQLKNELDSLYIRLREPENPPPHLFHYTTGEGLEGITRSNLVWASHSQFLNDKSEPKAAQEVLKEAINEIGKTCPADSVTGRSLASFWERAIALLDVSSPRSPGLVLYPDPVPELYVFCLSQPEDLLSQWRSYSKQASGYALGFSSRSVSE